MPNQVMLLGLLAGLLFAVSVTAVVNHGPLETMNGCLWLIWVLLTTVVTYIALPWLALPGLPIELGVRLIYWSLPQILITVTPSFVARAGLSWCIPLAARCVAVQLLCGPLCTRMLKGRLPYVKSLVVEAAPLSGVLRIRMTLDEAPLADLAATGAANSKGPRGPVGPLGNPSWTPLHSLRTGNTR
jgi:hypothetical protein